ncbi:unnamed protein product [Ixodes hexagonus]
MSTHFFLKLILFLMNFVYWLFGGTTFLMGLYLFTVKERILRHYVDLTFDPAVFFMTLGCIVFLLATCGCVGVLRENVRLLCVYSSALTVVLMISIAVGLLAFLLPSLSVRGRLPIENTLRRAIVIYRDDPTLEELIDMLQSSLHCCGLTSNGYLDWRLNAYFNCSVWNYSRERCGVPYSCCRDVGRFQNVMCGYDVTDVAKMDAASVQRRIYTGGCIRAIEHFVRQNGVLVSVLSTVTVGSLAVGMAVAWVLLESVRATQIRQDQGTTVEREPRPESAI